MKKIICFCFTVLCLALSCGAAYASGDLTDKQREAVAVLSDLDIMTGITEDNALEKVTRASFAEVVVKLCGAEELNPQPRRIYTDVMPDDDAAASIEYLYDRGIMVGYEPAIFLPDNNITINEVIKVMITITGYTDWAEREGGYPKGYFQIASQNKLLDGVSGKDIEPIDYANLAVIVQNVLETKKYVTVSGYNKNGPVQNTNNSQDYMGYVLNVFRYSGICEGSGVTSLESASVSYTDDACVIGGERFNKGSRDLAEYIGEKVKIYYKIINDEYVLVHIAADKDNSVTEVDSDDIIEDSTLALFKYYDNDKEKKLKISPDAIFIYNGKRLAVVSDADILSENGSVRLIDNNDDSVYDVVMIKEYKTYVVEKVIGADEKAYFKYDMGSLSFKDGDGFETVYYTDGAETDFSSISAGSVLSIAFSRNTEGDIAAEVLISNNIIQGKATAIGNTGNGRSVILEDGSEYPYTVDFQNRLDAEQQRTYEPELGTDASFYIDYFGKLAAYTFESSGKNYGYVVKCWYDSIEEKGQIKLFTKDAVFETFDFANKVRFNGEVYSKKAIPESLKLTGTDGGIYQLVIYEINEDKELVGVKTAKNKLNEIYYISSEDEFVLNAHPKNSAGVPAGMRFYKNMAENRPFTYVNGKTIQFMVPTDKSDEKSYKIANKLSSTDESVPAPVYVYDAGPAGAIGAIVTNTANEGKYTYANIVDRVVETLDEDDEPCYEIRFVGGTSALLNEVYVTYMQPARSDSKGANNWSSRIDYSDVTVKNLKRGDVIEYTTSNNKVELLKVVVKADNIGPVRIDGDNIQLNGNMVADVISVADDGKTALVYYVDRFGTEQYQSMMVNGTVYRYESSEDKVYNSSTAELTAGDRVLINSFWWSPKVIVIYR